MRYITSSETTYPHLGMKVRVSQSFPTKALAQEHRDYMRQAMRAQGGQFESDNPLQGHTFTATFMDCESDRGKVGEDYVHLTLYPATFLTAPRALIECPEVDVEVRVVTEKRAEYVYYTFDDQDRLQLAHVEKDDHGRHFFVQSSPIQNPNNATTGVV